MYHLLPSNVEESSFKVYVSSVLASTIYGTGSSCEMPLATGVVNALNECVSVQAFCNCFMFDLEGSMWVGINGMFLVHLV